LKSFVLGTQDIGVHTPWIAAVVGGTWSHSVQQL
jgi:hypothetical protein